MKKWCVTGIILLFVGTCTIPSIAQNTENASLPTSKGNWLYVGGSGPGNYSNIPEAMENATNGDTIYVYSGIYGTLTIRKSLNIIGENKYTTILNGSGASAHDAVAIEANDVNLSGFTIQNGGNPDLGYYGRGISLQQRTNVKVFDVILRHNYLAIIHYWNTNVLLENITFINNGISFWDGKNCTIRYCTFEHAGISHGGFPPSGAGCSLYIHYNKFLNDSIIGMGDQCGDSFGNTTIESNLFQNNSCALSISSSKGINIIKNNFIQNTKNVALSQEAFILQYLKNKSKSQNWVENYWDDWNHIGSYPIPGKMTLDIGIPFIFHFTLVLIPLPVLKFRYKEFDPNPAIYPYQIP